MIKPKGTFILVIIFLLFLTFGVWIGLHLPPYGNYEDSILISIIDDGGVEVIENDRTDFFDSLSSQLEISEDELIVSDTYSELIVTDTSEVIQNFDSLDNSETDEQNIQIHIEEDVELGSVDIVDTNENVIHDNFEEIDVYYEYPDDSNFSDSVFPDPDTFEEF